MIRDIIPTQNVTWDDIRDTLNAGGGAVTNSTVSAFLDSANINIWSFYKPHHALITFPTKVPDAIGPSGSLYYEPSTHTIKHDKPRGGAESPYRLSDFCGYKYKSLPPSVDSTGLMATYNLNTARLSLTLEPYWGDPNFDLGKIFKLNFDEMQIKVEVYNSSKNLITSGKFIVGEGDSIGRYHLDVTTSEIKRTDTKIYLKGYFCDSYGSELCMIPSSPEGFVEKPITVTQSLYIYKGEISSLTSGFTASFVLTDGDGSYIPRITLTVYNTSGSNYLADTGYPIVKIRYRAKDGTYTSEWTSISSSNLTYLKDIPNNITRSDTLIVNVPPTQGSITEWYMDVQIQMK